MHTHNKTDTKTKNLALRGGGEVDAVGKTAFNAGDAYLSSLSATFEMKAKAATAKDSVIAKVISSLFLLPKSMMVRESDGDGFFFLRSVTAFYAHVRGLCFVFFL